MKNVFDVDEFLKEATFTVKLHGKEFSVSDIPEEVVDKFGSEEHTAKEILKDILNCTDEDLKGYGAVALARLIKEITNHFFQSDLLKGLSEDLSKQGQ
jgi:hypothetical protein